MPYFRYPGQARPGMPRLRYRRGDGCAGHRREEKGHEPWLRGFHLPSFRFELGCLADVRCHGVRPASAGSRQTRHRVVFERPRCQPVRSSGPQRRRDSHRSAQCRYRAGAVQHHGLGGAKIEAKYVDEAGSTAQVVTEFRNLVQRDHVDAVVGYVSSGSCLRRHTGGGGTEGSHRLFRLRHAAHFRGKAAHAMYSAPVRHRHHGQCRRRRYLLARHRRRHQSIHGINQNYACGQDAGAISRRDGGAGAEDRGSTRTLFPKLFAGEYGAEI